RALRQPKRQAHLHGRRRRRRPARRHRPDLAASGRRRLRSPVPVTRFEIITRRPLADGAAFGGPTGEVGPYEELKGRLHFVIDPLHPANRRITDVELAPRSAAGRVEWWSDVSILLPVDRARCSGRVL